MNYCTCMNTRTYNCSICGKPEEVKEYTDKEIEKMHSTILKHCKIIRKLLKKK